MEIDRSISARRTSENDELVDLLSGGIANKFLPESEPTLTINFNRNVSMLRMALSDDCGSILLGCPPATQDPVACPTVDTGLPSCGLCPDTNPPPAGHCHLGETDPGVCPPFTECETYPPPPQSGDCGTFTPADTYDLCETPDTVHHVRCTAPPHEE